MEDEMKLRFFPIRCPVCKGRGTVNWDKEICGACKGRGYIIIDQLTGREVGAEDEHQSRLD